MEKPKVKIAKQQDTVMNNLFKIFPNSIDGFTIHIIFQGKGKILSSNEKIITNRLATFLSIGDEKKYLETEIAKCNANVFLEHNDSPCESISMQNNQGALKQIKVKIYGWIGTYKTTKDMKKEINEFSDNFLALFAHNKMWMRNVLPIVGKNRVYESYIVRNLYIDAFEDSDFPDMAGTNRQEYNESDPRWTCALGYIRQ